MPSRGQAGGYPHNMALDPQPAVDNLDSDDCSDAGEVENHSDSLSRSEPDLAAGALDAARAMTSGSSAPSSSAGARSRWAPGGKRRHRGRGLEATYSTARPDERDPMLIGRLVTQVAENLGWSAPMARARVLGQWNELVGSAIAERCQPVSLDGSVLRLSAESTAWATQLRMMAPQILARICAELPPGTVTQLLITGPSVHSWRRGPWSMSGGRGVRDTYG